MCWFFLSFEPFPQCAPLKGSTCLVKAAVLDHCSLNLLLGTFSSLSSAPHAPLALVDARLAKRDRSCRLCVPETASASLPEARSSQTSGSDTKWFLHS